jgi:hypothetical protein
MRGWLPSDASGGGTGASQRTFGRSRSQSSAPLFGGSRGKPTGPGFDIAIDEEDNPFSDSSRSRPRSQSSSSVSSASRGLKSIDDNVLSALSPVSEAGGTSASSSTKAIAKRKHISKEDTAKDAKKKKEAWGESPSRVDQGTSSSAFGQTQMGT